MIKKHVCLWLLILFGALLIIPVLPLMASNITNADFYGTIQTTNNGTAATNVTSNVSGLNSTNLIAGAFLNSSANNCAIRSSSGADLVFMPGYGANTWDIFFPSLGANTITNSILYTKNVTGGLIRYFPGAAGMAVVDGMTEPTTDASINLNDTFIDTTAGASKYIVNKPNSFNVSIDNIASQKVIFSSVNNTSLQLVRANTDYVQVSDTTDYSFTDGAGNDLPFTMSFWIKPTSTGTQQTIICKSDSATTYEWYIEKNVANTISVTLASPTAATRLAKTTTATFSNGVWYHIGITYSGSETITGLKLYINGTYQTSTTNTTVGAYAGMSNTLSVMEMGRILGVGGPANYLDATLSNVKIYKNRCFSAAEVLNDYNFNCTSTSMVGWYPLCESTGIPTDISGSAHNAIANTGDWLITGGKFYRSAFLTSILSAEYDVTATIASNTMTITCGASTNSTYAGTLGLANSVGAWQFGSLSTTLYIGTIIYTKGGTQRGYWYWQYGTTFTDHSGNSNTGTPAFRTTSSDVDVSSILTLFMPVSEPTAPPFAVGAGPDLISGNITATETPNPVSGNAIIDYPLKPFVDAVGTAGSFPKQWLPTFISVFCLLALSIVTSYFLKESGAGSIFIKSCVNIVCYGVLVALNIFDWWMLIFFFIFEQAIWFAAKERRE